MPVLNADIASAFEEVADLLELQQANPFRVRAYRRAALLLRSQGRELHERVTAGFDPDALPGIGADLAGKIRELLESGGLRLLERLRRGSPPGMRELLRLPGLGPVRVRRLRAALGVTDLASLREAVATHRLARARGLGPALEARLARAFAAPAQPAGRHLRADAGARASAFRNWLEGQRGIVAAATAGSLRRGRDTIGDVDMLICSRSAPDLRRLLARCADVESLQSSGPTRASGTLRGGLAFDLRCVEPRSFGAALVYFTGSKAHNIRLRARARERGLRINEYGVYRGARQIAGETERSVYGAIGLPEIAPELREDRGELEAAIAGRLPALVARRDLRGDLHVHTRASDGQASLAQMAAAAAQHGLEYLGIADHARHLGIVHGLDADALARQAEEIDALNRTLRGIVLLKGVEVDVAEDGALLLPLAALRRLDFVVVALHDHLGLSRRRQTDRLLRALEHPCASILAHPTTRLLPDRPPIAADWERVFRRAAERPCALELNAQPARLDLDEALVRAAAEAGVLISIATDAHGTEELALLEDGVVQARRGWLGPAQVLNARPLRGLQTFLAATRRS